MLVYQFICHNIKYVSFLVWRNRHACFHQLTLIPQRSSGNFRCLLIAFANILDPDQAPHVKGCEILLPTKMIVLLFQHSYEESDLP